MANMSSDGSDTESSDEFFDAEDSTPNRLGKYVEVVQVLN